MNEFNITFYMVVNDGHLGSCSKDPLLVFAAKLPFVPTKDMELELFGERNDPGQVETVIWKHEKKRFDVWLMTDTSIRDEFHITDIFPRQEYIERCKVLTAKYLAMGWRQNNR